LLKNSRNVKTCGRFCRSEFVVEIAAHRDMSSLQCAQFEPLRPRCRMRIFLAPMEGVVEHTLRTLYAAIGGIDLFVTEFIRVTETHLPSKVFKRYCPELDSPLAVPVRVQLLGSNPHTLALNARRAAALGAPGIDLNFGCPAKTVNKNRGGACLLQEPNLLYDIVSAVRAAVPAAIPVTAKIRLGYERRENYLENALALEAAGAAELVVHARSKTDGYKPPAYWLCIGEIRRALAIPVVANGEIWTVADYFECKDQSGCTDFMLGRGLLARPDLALAIKAAEQGQAFTPLTWSTLAGKLYRFHQSTLGQYPAKYCGNRLKQWLMYLQRQYPEAEAMFQVMKRAQSAEDIAARFADLGIIDDSPLRSLG
jgi:tRNA-dihydrouridine synthase C